jgi:hypothetical protein
MRLILAGLVLLGGVTVAASPSLLRTKPLPPLALAARIEGRTLIVSAAPAAASSVEVRAGRHRSRCDLRRGECRESRFEIDDPAAELVVTATAMIDGVPVTRAITLNSRPAADRGRVVRNSRGEAIVEVVER